MSTTNTASLIYSVLTQQNSSREKGGRVTGKWADGGKRTACAKNLLVKQSAHSSQMSQSRSLCAHISFMFNYCHKQMKWATCGTRRKSPSSAGHRIASFWLFAFLQSSTAMQRVCVWSDAVSLMSFVLNITDLRITVKTLSVFMTDQQQM